MMVAHRQPASPAHRSAISRGAEPQPVAERGAVPQVSAARRRALALIRSFTSPLLPDDYLELVNPLWSTRELRGRIERIERETADAVTVADQARLGVAGAPPRPVPAPGHRGRRRPPLARLLADLRPAARGRLHRDHAEARRGRQGLAVPVRGACARERSCAWAASKARSCCPTRCRERLLFISAGSGITPIMSMLRTPRRRGRAARRRARAQRAQRRRA